MIKLKKLVTEEKDEYISTETFTPAQINQIKRELQRKKQFRTLILRGTRLDNFDYRTSKIRDDRKLKDTLSQVSDIATAFYNDYEYDIPDRRKCLFATNNARFAKGYGNVVTTIFPSKKTNVIYNPEYDDSYLVTDTIGFTNYYISTMDQSGYFKKIYKDKQNEYPVYFKFYNALYDYTHEVSSEGRFRSILLDISFETLWTDIVKFISNELNDNAMASITDGNDMSVKRTIIAQKKFFEDAIKYARGIKFLNEDDDLSDKGKIELIVYGDSEYFQINYDKFINSFEWTGHEWEPKTI